MKNTFKLSILFILLFSIKSYAQLDTLNYLKQFEANKANYIGQPFSKLLNDMTQIQPKTLFSYSPFNNKNVKSRTLFNFCSQEFEIDRNVINMVIFWETPLLKSNVVYYENLNNHLFTNDEKNFYGNKIVKDIKVYR